MPFLQFKNLDGGNKTPELLIYGEIGGWWDGVDAKEFNQTLMSITSPEINVRINSGGGDVFTAQAIYAALRRHSATINIYIDGIAASAATIPAMAGDRIIMPAGSMMMVHNPLTYIYGNAEDMREVADVLDKVRDAIMAAYVDKTGLAEERLKELMDAETYMTAAEAVELGFATEIEHDLKIAASLTREKMVVNNVVMNHKRLANMPDSWLTKPENNVQSSNKAGLAGNEPKEPVKENPVMNLDKLKADHPELYQAILEEGVQAGVTQERARIKAIEDMAMAGHDDIANAAKFETGISAEAYAVEVIKAEKGKRNDFLSKRKDDASSLDPVAPSVTQPEADAEEAEIQAIIKDAAAAKNGYHARAK